MKFKQGDKVTVVFTQGAEPQDGTVTAVSPAVVRIVFENGQKIFHSLTARKPSDRYRITHVNGASV